MTVLTTAGTPGINRFTRSQLLRTARLFATDPDLHTLVDLARPSAGGGGWTPRRTWRSGC